MVRLTEVIEDGDAPAAPGTGEPALTLTLTFEDRRRSRLLVRLDDGSEAALLLPRGTHLREGQRLRGEGGSPVVEVRAASQLLSVASTRDPHLLARAAYHLGNRHVPLQLGQGWLAYEHDHVLDDLARGLGLAVASQSGPFEPEAGGYGGHSHSHGHGHGPSHGRGLGDTGSESQAPHDHAGADAAPAHHNHHEHDS